MEDIYGRHIPWIWRLLGCWSIVDGHTYRCKRFELTKRFALACELTAHEEKTMLMLGLFFFQIFIYLPSWLGENAFCEAPTYGFSFCDGGVHLHWAHKIKIIDYPWNYEWVSREVLRDGKRCYMETAKYRISFEHGYEARKVAEKHASQSFPYTYTLKNGTVQNRTATCFVCRDTRRMKCLPFLKRVRTYMDFEFSEEVGERSGSWKGGCIASSYEMKRGETLEQTLRRMESERKF